MDENKIAKKLGISSLINVPGSKFEDVFGLINDKKIDKELAMKILESSSEIFSATKEYLTETIPEALEEIIQASKEETVQRVEIISNVQKSLANALEKLVDKEEISFEEIQFLANKQVELANMIKEMDSESKGFYKQHMSMVNTIAMGLLAVVGGAYIAATNGESSNKEVK